MTEQVIIKMDSKLKRGVQKRAKAEGTTLSAVLRFAAMLYVSGQIKVGLFDISWAPTEEEDFNDKNKRSLARAIRDSGLGRNIYPPLTNAKEARNYLGLRNHRELYNK